MFPRRTFLALSGAAFAQSLCAAGADLLNNAALDALRSRAGAPALAVAAQSGAGRGLNLAVGLRQARRPEPVTGDDLWHLGSITKPMTATLIARAVEAGAIRWDDRIGDVLGGHLPGIRQDYQLVTFRHLCAHRAGLPANIAGLDLLRFPRSSRDAPADRLAYSGIALAMAPSGRAGSGYLYSNAGYIIAGAMLELRLGAPWEALMREHVFIPLGMESAGFGPPGQRGQHDQPVGHSRSILGLVPHPPKGRLVADNPTVLGPAGRVHAGLDDVLTFLAAHGERREPFLSRASWQVLHTPPFGGDYAMGWGVRPDGAIWHNGSNSFWYAEMLADPKRGLRAVAATNYGDLDGVRPVVADTLAAALAAIS